MVAVMQKFRGRKAAVVMLWGLAGAIALLHAAMQYTGVTPMSTALKPSSSRNGGRRIHQISEAGGSASTPQASKVGLRSNGQGKSDNVAEKDVPFNLVNIPGGLVVGLFAAFGSTAAFANISLAVPTIFATLLVTWFTTRRNPDSWSAFTRERPVKKPEVDKEPPVYVVALAGFFGSALAAAYFLAAFVVAQQSTGAGLAMVGVFLFFWSKLIAPL